MLSGVLNSKRAVAVNIAIMRAFVEMRRAVAGYSALEKRLDQLERDAGSRLGQHDEQLNEIFSALRQLICPAGSTKAASRVQATRGRRLGEALMQGAHSEDRSSVQIPSG